jgi:hypothetical protein
LFALTLGEAVVFFCPHIIFVISQLQLAGSWYTHNDKTVQTFSATKKSQTNLFAKKEG